MVSVTNPFNGNIVGQVRTVPADEISGVIARAARGRLIARELPRHARGNILDRAARSILERREWVAHVIVSESGKTIRQARKEVLRTANTLKLSAAEATRNAWVWHSELAPPLRFSVV